MAACAQGVPHHSVFVVDSHRDYPPLPPRLKTPRQGLGVAQTLLFILVSLALCGMAIEACLIYRLYQPNSVSICTITTLPGLGSGDKQGIAFPPPTKRLNTVVLPSKPVAHLTAGPQPPKGDELMTWNMIAEPLLYQMEYRDGRLTIQKEGYYYVYSKVFYSETNNPLSNKSQFTHSVRIITPNYLGQDIPILQSRGHHPYRRSEKDSLATSNSVLSGVFHLRKNESLVVMVSNTSQIIIAHSYENYFGAYML
ncbi:tumor necrosis factor ligand superfamily member 14 [Aplochiton taeniatus]